MSATAEASEYASELVIYPRYEFKPEIAKKLAARVENEYRHSLATSSERCVRSVIDKWITAHDGDRLSLGRVMIEVTFEETETQGMDSTMCIAEARLANKFREE